jgi:site-specific DNA-methyltransferase (adenine-specific)
MKNKRALFTSERQNWKTPKRFYEALDQEFFFDFDPCPPNPNFDGLAVEWGQRNFVNPPYNQIKLWVARAFEQAQKGKLVVMLIPSRTDTRWWHEYVMKADEIRFIQGRLSFDDCGRPAPFPSCVVVFRG